MIQGDESVPVASGLYHAWLLIVRDEAGVPLYAEPFDELDDLTAREAAIRATPDGDGLRFAHFAGGHDEAGMTLYTDDDVYRTASPTTEQDRGGS